MILGEPPAWNEDAISLLRQFLESGVGQVFLAQLAAQRPALSSGSDLNTVALQAKEVAGYERALNTILSLSESPEDPVPTEEAYPPLDDDKQWPKKS